MRNDEIPREQWPRFFHRFVRSHRGHLCSLAVTTRDESRAIRLGPMPLALVGPEDDEDPRVRVLLTGWDGDPIGYSIVSPLHVFLTLGKDGANEILEIDGAGTRTTMMFQPAS